MRLISIVVAIVALAISSAASAEESAPHRRKMVGAQIDVGIPNGVGLSVVGKPCKWAHLNIGATYNGMAPGMFAGLTIDPINFGISPTLTGEVGGSFRGRLPGVANAPDMSYQYINLWPGIEFGSRDNWRLFLRGGVTWVKGTVYNLDELSKNNDTSLTFSDPKFSFRVAPTAKLGFLVYF
jgi:hypothetical protein